MSIATKLVTLNTLRLAAGKTELVSWKASEADLDQRILDMTPTYSTAKPAAGPDADTILASMEKAVKKSKVPVTVLPPAADVAKSAKRAAVIKQIAATSVAKDVPTTVIDAKAASRVINKAAKKAKAPKKAAKVAPKAKSTKKATTNAPRSGNEFGALLTELGINPKQARATLRRKGFSAPYTNLKDIRAALTTDARKAK